MAKKPKDLSFEKAAAVPLAAMTAYRASITTGALKKGNTVFIAGAGGGVGSFAVPMVRSFSTTIFTVAKDTESSRFLQDLEIPKDHILLYGGLSHEEIKKKLLAMNNGRFFDVTLDLVGGEVKKLCLELTGYSGHFSSIVPEKETFSFPIWHGAGICSSRNMSIHQARVGAELEDPDASYWQIYTRHLHSISDMLKDGRLKAPVVEVVGLLAWILSRGRMRCLNKEG